MLGAPPETPYSYSLSYSRRLIPNKTLKKLKQGYLRLRSTTPASPKKPSKVGWTVEGAETKEIET
jgi:hypothetical protein